MLVGKTPVINDSYWVTELGGAGFPPQMTIHAWRFASYIFCWLMLVRLSRRCAWKGKSFSATLWLWMAFNKTSSHLQSDMLPTQCLLREPKLSLLYPGCKPPVKSRYLRRSLGLLLRLFGLETRHVPSQPSTSLATIQVQTLMASPFQTFPYLSHRASRSKASCSDSSASMLSAACTKDMSRHLPVQAEGRGLLKLLLQVLRQMAHVHALDVAWCGGFHWWGYPKNGWFVMRMDDLRAPPFQETSM